MLLKQKKHVKPEYFQKSLSKHEYLKLLKLQYT